MENPNPKPKPKKAKRQKTFEIRFFEELLKSRPNFVEALACLGDAYTKKGFFEEGLEVDLRLTKLRPNDPITHYNLACSYSLLERLDQSLRALKKAVLLGYEDFSYITKDKDLKNLRKDRRFDDLMHKVTRKLCVKRKGLQKRENTYG